IGKAVAKKLAVEGAHVVVTDLDAAGAQAVADDVVKAVGGGRALGLGMDVTSAGIAHGAAVADMRLEDWERSFAVNARGHFLVAREAMRVLVTQGLGGA